MKITKTYYEEAVTRIDPDRYYSIGEIVKRRYLLNTVGKADRVYVHRMVKNDMLPARDVGYKTRPFYKILGEDLIALIEKLYL